MINLLPDDHKKEIRAARANVILLRYNIVALVGLAVTLGICLLFFIILRNTQANAISTSNGNTVKASSFDKVIKESNEYRSNLKIASKILDNSVNYTNVVFEITKLLPRGVVLDGISLTAEDFGRETVFTARAKTYDNAMQLKDSFQKSKVFENVHFQSLNDAATGDYPLTVAMSVKLKKVDNTLLTGTEVKP